MKLVPEWRSIWRSSSVLFQTASVAFFTFIANVTDVVSQTWTLLPQDVKEYLPPWAFYSIGIILLFGGIVSRVVAQQSLTEARKKAKKDV